MNEELELLKDVARRLERAGIDYMITGSLAMAVYAIPRMTRDIDIIIQATSKDVDKIIGMLEKDFYIDKGSVRRAIQSCGMFNAIHNESVIKVDFIVRKNETYRLEEFSRRRKIDVQGASIAVVSPEDLILSKLVWAKQASSELQMKDVRRMTSMDVDRNYLEKWTRILDVNELWNKAQKDE
ncbi:MAG: nucleotidyltransferase [Sedimentisphaerales bacterium]|nr:nucleotidyltransferase [Sedimentisphaerales bacterium]